MITIFVSCILHFVELHFPKTPLDCTPPPPPPKEYKDRRKRQNRSRNSLTSCYAQRVCPQFLDCFPTDKPCQLVQATTLALSLFPLPLCAFIGRISNFYTSTPYLRLLTINCDADARKLGIHFQKQNPPKIYSQSSRTEHKILGLGEVKACNVFGGYVGKGWQRKGVTGYRLSISCVHTIHLPS